MKQGSSDVVKAKIIYYKDKLNLRWDAIARKISDDFKEYFSPERVRSIYRRIDDASKSLLIDKYADDFDNIDKDFALSVKDYVLQNPMSSIIQLSDHFDVSPKKISSAISLLRDMGFDVSSKIVDGSEKVDIRRSNNGEKAVFSVGEKESVVRFGLVSDTHLASKYADIESLHAIYDIFNQEGITSVYHAGNLVDGEKTYIGHEYEILVNGAEGQADYVAEHYPKIDGITTYFIGSSTCHEGGFYKKTGLVFGKLVEMRRKDMVHLGLDEVDVTINTPSGDIILRILHPSGGTAYSLSYKPQKIMESIADSFLAQHNISDTRSEVKTIPDILAIGHFHKSNQQELFGCYTIQAGCFQHQTPFMRKRNISAHIGGYIIEVKVIDNRLISRIKVEWIPAGRIRRFFNY